MRVLTPGPARVPVLLGLLLLLAAPQAVAQQESETPVQVLELSLADAVELTLRHNLQVRIASLNPDIAEEQIRFARSQFDSVFTFSLPQAFNRSSSPTSSTLAGADVLTNEQLVGGFRFDNNTTWGLGWSIQASASRFVTNNTFTTFNPRFDTSVRVDVRQPLLRNFGKTANTRTLVVAQNDFSVSREFFRQQLQNSIFQIIQAYWQLVSRYRSLDIARESQQLAQEQHDRNQTMVRIGVLAAVNLIQTEQQVADADLTLVQNEILLSNQQDLMKSLMNLDAVVAEGWEVEIIPTDDPATDAEPIVAAAAVLEALQKSPNVRQDRINLSSRRLDLKAANNQLLPQLDFIGNVQLSGLGGDQIFRAQGGILEVQGGALGDSFQQLLSGDFRNWTLGLQLQIPVRNDAARAQYAQASIRERQASTQVQDDEIQIRLAVNNAIRNVEGGVQQVRAAENASRLAELQYIAELRRFENATSTTFQVLSMQRQLTLSRQRELNSVINLNLAIANFELNKGTLLETFGVEVDDAGTGGPSMQSRQSTPTQIDAAAAEALAKATPKPVPTPLDRLQKSEAR